MIDKIANILTNPNFANFAMNTKYTVTTESIFKATGRPAAIMLDKNVDLDTRKYAATKEGLYQLLCLGIYLTMIPLVFKKYGFKIAQKILKNDSDLPNFKDANEYLAYAKLASRKKADRNDAKTLAKISDNLKINDTDKFTLKEHLLNDEKPPEFPVAKGALELSNLVGTVIGLAWIASELSNHILHPLMRMLGFEKKPEKQSGININS